MELDFTKLSVDEIRAELAKITGENISVFEQIKGKSKLVEKYNEVVNGNPFSNVEEELEKNGTFQNTEEENKTQETVPLLGSPEWQPYVLSLLTADEIVTKEGITYPKSSGLRRVSQQLLGPIIKSGPTQVFPEAGDKYKCTVIYEVVFMWTYGIPAYRSGILSEVEILRTEYATRCFSEVSECHSDNTLEKYAIHSAATAATRAEGRALRKALQLNIVTADEISSEILSSDTVAVEENPEKEQITELQRISIQSLCKRLKINLPKMLEFCNMPELLNCNKAHGMQLMATLNKYQNTSDDKISIPDFIKESSL